MAGWGRRGDSGPAVAWRSAIVPVAARGVANVPLARAHPERFEAAHPQQASQAWVKAVDAMVDWYRADNGPLWTVEGPAGAGKTRLAEEFAQRLSVSGVPCGWARPGMGAFAITSAARNGQRALIIVDDAETRADLGEMLRTLANKGKPLPVRVVVLARDFGPWWQALTVRLTTVELTGLAPRRLVLGATATPASPRALALRSLDIAALGNQDQAALLASADPATGAVLLRQAALVVALSTRVGQLGPAQARAALRDLFEEEEGYWRRAASEVTRPGQPSASLRSALVTSAVVAGDGLADAAALLRRVPTLAVGAADRLARLALWWHGLYASPEPTATGPTHTPRLPAWLADYLPGDGQAPPQAGHSAAAVSREGRPAVAWTVAALDAERRVTSTLARMALAAHRDIWPSLPPGDTGPADEAADAHDALRAGVDAAGPVDQALAWLAEELELSVEDLDNVSDAISYPTRTLARTAIVLARRLLDTVDTEADRAAFLLSLGARHSEVGDWQVARTHTEAAVLSLRVLARTDPQRYGVELAQGLANLATCLVHLEELAPAADAAYEAVAEYRKLNEAKSDPALARSLVTLSACLSRLGRIAAAAGAAGQAVAIYRAVLDLQPALYGPLLKTAQHNWRVCIRALDRPAP